MNHSLLLYLIVIIFLHNSCKMICSENTPSPSTTLTEDVLQGRLTQQLPENHQQGVEHAVVTCSPEPASDEYPQMVSPGLDPLPHLV